MNEGLQKAARMREDFCRLFQRASADGRGEALFGRDADDNGAAAAEAVERSSFAHTGRIHYYFEFPLAGRPGLDIMVQYRCGSLLPGASFIKGDGFGYQQLFGRLAEDQSFANYLSFFAFDLSGGREQPNVYLMPQLAHANCEYVPRMLELLGEEERTEKTMQAFSAAPSGWQPYYAGLMKTREGAPIRLGFVTRPGLVGHYAGDRAAIARDFGVYYPGGVPGVVCEQLMHLAKATEEDACWDIQLNLFDDGSFDDDLGITPDMGFRYNDVRHSERTLESDRVSRVMELLESWNCADGRWHRMGEACCGIQRMAGYKTSAGTIERRKVADAIQLNAVKVRLKRAGAYLAKGYLIATTWDP